MNCCALCCSTCLHSMPSQSPSTVNASFFYTPNSQHFHQRLEPQRNREPLTSGFAEGPLNISSVARSSDSHGCHTSCSPDDPGSYTHVFTGLSRSYSLLGILLHEGLSVCLVCYLCDGGLENLVALHGSNPPEDCSPGRCYWMSVVLLFCLIRDQSNRLISHVDTGGLMATLHYSRLSSIRVEGVLHGLLMDGKSCSSLRCAIDIHLVLTDHPFSSIFVRVPLGKALNKPVVIYL